MYEYLLENLISYSQVDGNLRRTADRGLVSELYRKQMNALALKYFGVDSNGNYTENKEDIVAYRCPYSGEIISDLSTAHLEHILPVSSNGGTVLFNCIPILNKVNLSKRDEPNLLVWWQEQDFFNYDRLERLIQYMLEAYTLAFKEPPEDELYDYDNSFNNDDYIENDDLSVDLKDRISNKTNINIQQNITYYQLINDLINELSKNRDVSKFNSKLNNLKEQNTFGNINELEKVINAVQTVLKNILGENSKHYLSYSLKIDMNKLLQSLDKTNYEQEIRRRFEYIQLIIKDNNISITDFFDNLKDINSVNLIYYDIDKITDTEKNNFIRSIKISHNAKVLVFIEMLSDPKYTSYKDGLPDENNIFSNANKVGFLGYEHIDGLSTSQFWRTNLDEIITLIYSQKEELEKKENRTTEEEQKLIKLNRAIKAIDDYKFANKANPKYRIEKFIEMLSNSKYTSYKNGDPDENNIFAARNMVQFEGYEHINGLNTSQFWRTHSDEIMRMIYSQKEELEKKENRTTEEEQKLIKLNRAIKAIDDYNFVNKSNPKYRIEKFIEMLSNPKYTSYKNGDPDENNIFSIRNKIQFEGYEHINGLSTSQFWKNNSDEIIISIYSQKEELEKKENRTTEEEQKLIKLNRAIKAIDDYNFINRNNLEYRIEKFIEMLSNPKYTGYKDGVPDENNIFSNTNKIQFEGYEHIIGLNTSQFWSKYLDRIIIVINSQKEELEKKENRTTEEEQKLIKLNRAIKAIDDYKFINKKNAEYRIEKFIEMLSNPKYTSYKNGYPDENNIFPDNNKVHFEGYEHIDGLSASKFWYGHAIKSIIPLLFYNSSYNDVKYDSARNAVMEYLNYNRRRKKQSEFKTIDEYIDTLDKTKKEVKALIELRDSLLLRKEQLIIENQELTEELNSSYRRAM